MRLFVAVQLNHDIRESLLDVQNQWIRRGVRGNYTDPENLHLTLAFIGEYPNPDDVLDVIESLTFQPFSLSLDGIGNFGDLWWVGLSESDSLDALVRRLRHALQIHIFCQRFILGMYF